jgi:transmembrane sensor
MTTEPRGLMERIRRAASEVDPALGDGDVERIVGGLPQRRRRRAVGRLALAGTAVVGALSLALLVSRGWQPNLAGTPAPGHELAAGEVTAPVGAPLRLADGSVATRLDTDTALAVIENSAGHVTLDLRRGRGRFEVAPRPAAQRSFHVRAGEVTVTVIGTRFTVERVADRIGVVVEHGTVQVAWARGARPLRAGESGWFPPLAPVETAETQAPGARAAAEPGAPPPPARSPRPPAPTPAPAPLATEVAPPPAALDAPSAEQLLRAADTARMAGRTAEAATLLRRLVGDRPGDPRAPLAAFTLGRLLLRELGRAREAAVAFAEARALAPAGPLAEDALAREAEALAQVGARDEARARAREYLHHYPTGRRAPLLRALGGPD